MTSETETSTSVEAASPLDLTALPRVSKPGRVPIKSWAATPDARTLEQVVPKKTTGEVGLLSAQSDRLVAGDVVWTDLFQGPSVTESRKTRRRPSTDSSTTSARLSATARTAPTWW